MVRFSHLCLKFMGRCFLMPVAQSWQVLATMPEIIVIIKGVILFPKCEVLTLCIGVASSPHYFQGSIEDMKKNWHAHFPPMVFKIWSQPNRCSVQHLQSRRKYLIFSSPTCCTAVATWVVTVALPPVYTFKMHSNRTVTLAHLMQDIRRFW